MKSTGTKIIIGSLFTMAAFVAGHFIYKAGNQQLGFTVGVLAFAPLALAAISAWKTDNKQWAKTLFWTVMIVWAAMLLTTMM